MCIRDSVDTDWLIATFFCGFAEPSSCKYIIPSFELSLIHIFKRKNQALENALTEKQQENVALLLEHQNEKQQALQDVYKRQG